MRRRIHTAAAVAFTALSVTLLSVQGALPAFAHGYTDGPVSRAGACASGQNQNCGSIQYEPQSLEAPKGFPESGPADGKLASAGGLFEGTLDEQSPDRWYKNPISTGPLSINWKYTAPHSTSGWHYYMTKPGWSGDKPLTRGDLELLTTVEHDGSPANTGGAHTVDIPADRSGYHVIYAVWDVADTPNAFYNVIDVQVGGGGGDSGSGDSGSTASEPAKTQPEKKTEPKKSEPTESDASKPAATKPEESGSDHSDHSDHSSHSDSSQSTAPETGTYAADGASGQHDHHAHGSVPAGDGPGVPATGGTSTAWSPTASYQAGDQVQHDGKTYRALQAYTGYGDPNWILAPSLWQQVG